MVLASSAQVCRCLVGRDGRAEPGLACCADPRVYQFPDDTTPHIRGENLVTTTEFTKSRLMREWSREAMLGSLEDVYAYPTAGQQMGAAEPLSCQTPVSPC